MEHKHIISRGLSDRVWMVYYLNGYYYICNEASKNPTKVEKSPKLNTAFKNKDWSVFEKIEKEVL